MKKPLATKIANTLSESITGADSAAYETITLRPAGEVAALITAINEVLHQPVLTLFTDEMSQKLCELLRGSVENEPLILDLLQEFPEQGSALASLLKNNAIVDDKYGIELET